MKQRNSVVGLLALACIIFVGGCGGSGGGGGAPLPHGTPTSTPTTAPTGPIGPNWTQYGYDSQRTGYNPNENTLSAANASTLKLVQEIVGPSGFNSVSQPLVATIGGKTLLYQVVYAPGAQSEVEAIDLSSGLTVWMQQYAGFVPPPACGYSPGVQLTMNETPLVDLGANRIYFVDAQAYVRALDLSTGAPIPGWGVQIAPDTDYNFYGALNYNPALGLLYVAVGNACELTGTHPGAVVSYNVANPSVPAAAFTAIVTPNYGGADIWGMGGVALGPDGSVYTATGNAWPFNGAPENDSVDYAEHVVKLGSDLSYQWSDFPPILAQYNGDDADFGSTPVVYQMKGCGPQIAVKNKYGQLFTYSTTSGPAQQTIQFGGSGNGNFILTVAFSPVDQMLFVTDSLDGGIESHGITALKPTPANPCLLQVAWHTTEGTESNIGDVPYSAPTVANGVVYYAGGTKVFAHSTTSGALLWSGVADSSVVAPPVVTAGKVIFGDVSGNVFEYGLP